MGAGCARMVYMVKEIYYTLQGEGVQTGIAAVFCRFAGCNLWSGREQHRVRAVCRFCDTDFVGINGPGGGKFAEAADLARAVAMRWPGGGQPMVVCTGGEPLLQLDEPLIEALHGLGFRIAVETNGTRTPPPGIDWLTVSPKAEAPLVATRGDELKLVYPQEGAEPEKYEGLDFRWFCLQPLDNEDQERNIQAAARYCLEHPQWRLSLQTQKLLGLP